MPKTGTAIVTDSLREIGVLDPSATASGPRLADGIRAATDLIGTWRSKRLFVRGITRNVFSLTNAQQSHTIGPSANFAQEYPQSIVKWSVIPDDDATDVLELPMGTPLTAYQWQQIRVKSTSGSYPTRMYYDRRYVSGNGNCLFWPVQDNADVDVVIYSFISQIVSVVAATTYDLPPGMDRVLTKNLALDLAPRYGKGATVTPLLVKQAADAMTELSIANMIPKEGIGRSEFLIGKNAGRRSFNVYHGS